jgi:5-methylcytosine-specific restriction endonuclease McrA
MPRPGANPRVANGHRRRQLRAQVLAEETTCWLCEKPVDTNLPHGTPESPELDEVLPISRGGSPYQRSNVRLAHRLCNQKRGNGIGRLARPHQHRFTTTRTWTV